MTLLITIGPTQEPIDAMRILSNRSTGDLGTFLALTLARAGYRVIALRGTGSTTDKEELLAECLKVIPFTTTADLDAELEKISLEAMETGDIGAVFHAAAVSDFFLPEAGSGKIPTRNGAVTLTLEPTPKLLPKMRGWFPSARITGWKFEASEKESGREDAISAAKNQIASCLSDACVLNGPAYGEGFGVLTKKGELTHFDDRKALCTHLTEQLGG